MTFTLLLATGRDRRHTWPDQQRKLGRSSTCCLVQTFPFAQLHPDILTLTSHSSRNCFTWSRRKTLVAAHRTSRQPTSHVVNAVGSQLASAKVLTHFDPFCAPPQDLNELNTWMEEFVRNGHSSVDALSDQVAHLHDLIQPPPAATPRLGEDPQGGASPAGIVGQIAALRDLITEVRDREMQTGPQETNQQRLEQLLDSVESERQHYQQQNNCPSLSFLGRFQPGSPVLILSLSLSL